MKFLVWILSFTLIGCGGGINTQDYITSTPDGDVAIPIKITNKNWTTCKKHYFEKDDGYIYDTEGNAIWQVICVNLYDEKTYAIPAVDWENEIEAYFVWVSVEQLKQWITDKEHIAEKTSLYADNVPEALEVLEAFLFEISEE